MMAHNCKTKWRAINPAKGGEIPQATHALGHTHHTRTPHTHTHTMLKRTISINRRMVDGWRKNARAAVMVLLLVGTKEQPDHVQTNQATNKTKLRGRERRQGHDRKQGCKQTHTHTHSPSLTHSHSHSLTHSHTYAHSNNSLEPTRSWFVCVCVCV